jgi:hypothetical protein
VQAEVAASGETPLAYMLRVMRDPTVEHARRDAMAWKAAPYVHPQMSAVKHSGDKDSPIQVVEWRVVGADHAPKSNGHTQPANTDVARLPAPVEAGER